jgi:hypothetical protein
VRTRGLFIAYGVPTALLLLALIAGLVIGRDSAFAFVPLVVVALTSPLWAFAALRVDRSDAHRHELLNAVDFQLTMLCGYLVGALLLLVFVGLLVIFAVLVAQASFGGSVVWQAMHDKPIPEPRIKMISFASRLGLA